MDSNKILISICFEFLKTGHRFNDERKQKKFKENTDLLLTQLFGKGHRHVIDLYVDRDITLGQLFRGIEFGLMKQKEEKKEEDRERSSLCLTLFNRARGNVETVKGVSYFPYLRVNRFEPNTVRVLRGLNSSDKISFFLHEADEKRRLYQLGFITSTELVIYSQDMGLGNIPNSVPKFSDDVIEAFKPSLDAMIQYPRYNISSRERYVFDNKTASILPAGDPPQKPDSDLMSLLLPSVLSMGVMGLVRSASGGGGFASLLLMVAMVGVNAVVCWLRIHNQNKKYASDLKKWRTDYQIYIKDRLDEMDAHQRRDVAKLSELYPDPLVLAQKEGHERSIYRYTDRIFSRSKTDDDFLSIRLGTSNRVKNLFEISAESKDEVFSAAGYRLTGNELRIVLNEERHKDELKNLALLPDEIQERYRYLPEAPLIYSLKKAGALGIVAPELKAPYKSERSYAKFRNTNAECMIKRILFDLCYHHSPEDLQIVVFMPPAKSQDLQEQAIRDYKYLPHFCGLLGDCSQFVFDEEGAGNVMSKLLSLMNDRAQKSEGEESSGAADAPCHIVLVVLHEYQLKEHAFAKYLPYAPETDQEYVNALGLSFVFMAEFKEYLPHYCDHILRMESDAPYTMTLTPRKNTSEVQPFVPWDSTEAPCLDGKAAQREKLWKQNLKDTARHYDNAFAFFAGVYYTQIAQNGKVPSSIGIFELFRDCGLEIGADTRRSVESFIKFHWNLDDPQGKRRHDVAKTLEVPLGRTDSDVAYLNMHERADGPHMLVAGTTGSGKSETVISWILGLCMYYRPEEVNLLLVDMKGGGFTQRLGRLPHIVGTVTDVDGDENGTGAVYMLHRFLEAITYEVKRRKLLLNEMGVDNVDDYIKACRDIESHIKTKRAGGQTAKRMRELAEKEPLSHLLLIVDEFTELKRFTAGDDELDFIGQITTIARVGRSLGYHIALISQNIQGAITEDISVNSKSRLCLKVATAQASKEMIGTDLAADPSMPGYGRAYLMVGTGSKFEYFQSAYSGVKVIAGNEAVTCDGLGEIPYKIVQVNHSGPYSSFFDSAEDNPEVKEVTKKLSEAGQVQSQLEVIVDAIIKVYNEDSEYRNVLKKAHPVFLKPLPQKLYLPEEDLD